MTQQHLNRTPLAADPHEGPRRPTTDDLHRAAENIAVPTYDWISEPIAGITDALAACHWHPHWHPHLHLRPHLHLWHRSHPAPPSG